MRITRYFCPDTGDGGSLGSSAGTLMAYEQPRINSVQRHSLNQHDFDDPQDSGQYLLPAVRASVEPHSANSRRFLKRNEARFLRPLITP